MKKIHHLLLLILACVTAIFTSCKKDVEGTAPFVFYSITVDGNKVTFDNKSTGASSYSWDFGDGASSNEASPVHMYPGKGKYVPTLVATSAKGTKAEASTVIHISKTSPVKLDDNSLADWDTIKYNMVVGDAASGNFLKTKYDYDANYVYLYFEQQTTKAAGNIYDLYIDADNDPTTGYVTGDIPGGGYEVLLEGTVFDGWLDVYYHSGDQASFGGYAAQSISEFYKMGTVVQSGNVQKFEWAISRSKIKGLTGSGMKIGIQVAANDWSATVGYSPDAGTNAFYLNMSE